VEFVEILSRTNLSDNEIEKCWVNLCLCFDKIPQETFDLYKDEFGKITKTPQNKDVLEVVQGEISTLQLLDALASETLIFKPL
jgi:hypothetical protein